METRGPRSWRESSDKNRRLSFQIFNVGSTLPRVESQAVAVGEGEYP